MSANRVGHARFITIGMNRGQQVFWLNEPEIGYVPLGSFSPRNPHTFVCVKLHLQGRSYFVEDLVLVEFSAQGGRESAITQQIDPYSLSPALRAESRLSIPDTLGLAYTWLGHKLSASHLRSDSMKEVFALTPEPTRQQLVEQVVKKIGLAGLFYTDSIQLRHIRQQLNNPYEGPRLPNNPAQLPEWLVAFINWEVTTLYARW